MSKFPQKIKEELKYYVYVYTYEEDDKEVLFYVGKGKGDRVFSHFNESQEKFNLSNLDSEITLTDKQRKIIEKNNIKTYIVNGGLTEEEAFFIEAQLISILTAFRHFELTNLVKGQHEFGIHTTDSIISKYAGAIGVEKIANDLGLKVIGFKINTDMYNKTLFRDSRGALEGMWKMSPIRANQADLVIGVHKGYIFGIYRVVKGSVIKIKDKYKNEDEWQEFIDLQASRGRIEKHINYQDMVDQNRSIIQLVPIAAPSSNNVKNEKPTEKEQIFIDKVLNRELQGTFRTNQNPILYIGNFKLF